MKKSWNTYLWIASLLYLILGFVNILFAWLGMICFITPLLITLLKGNKAYCNKYCGRGQLFSLLGNKFALSRQKTPPRWLSSNFFRYGFLTFFMIMFMNMVYTTYQVFISAPLHETITLLWTFKLPWHFNNHLLMSDWIVQFAFGFFSIMLTSTILGFITMVICKPRSWCVYCPMGTMTQAICKIQQRGR